MRKSIQYILAFVFGLLGLAMVITMVPGLLSVPSEQHPPTSISLTDEIVRALDWGNVAFDSPPRMHYEQRYPIELLLSPHFTADELREQLQLRLGSQVASIRISNRMEAQLSGTGFLIESMVPSIQVVTNQQVSRWLWQVVPIEPGQQTLHLSLSARVDVAGYDAPLVVQSLNRDIEVTVTLSQQIVGGISRHWQWLWLAILVPLGQVIWERRKRTNQSSTDGPSDTAGP